MDHRFGDQHGRGAARDQRGGDDDVLLGDVAGGERGLFRLVFRRHFLRIACRGFGGLELFILDRDELGAERGDLFLGGGAHVVGGHDRTEAAGRGDGLETGDAGAHDEHLGRGNGACGGHHHRHGAAIDLGAFDDGAVAGEVRLRGERVHRLGAGDSRGELHRQAGDLAGVERRDLVCCVGEGLHQGDQGRAFGQGRDLRRLRPADLEDDIRAGCCSGGAGSDGGARLGEGAVREAGDGARAGFDRHRVAEAHELLDGLRGCRNAGFTGSTFFEH